MEKPCTQMFIDKFGGVVKINDDHPLAIAQRAKGAEQAPAAGGGDPAPVVTPATFEVESSNAETAQINVQPAPVSTPQVPEAKPAETPKPQQHSGRRQQRVR